MQMTPEIYYRIMGKPFLALSSANPGFMNMGYWPLKSTVSAVSLIEAQAQLISLTLETLHQTLPSPKTILEAGSGWGGSRALVKQVFPQARYIGVNFSDEQVAYAQELNASDPNTSYLCKPIESVNIGDTGPVDAVIAVEAAIHFNKPKFFQVCRDIDADMIVLAEILVEDMQAVVADPFIAPALHLCNSFDQYINSFTASGFELVSNTDISERVFAGMEQAVGAIDPSGYQESPVILQQLKRAFSAMTAMNTNKCMTYNILAVRRQK